MMELKRINVQAEEGCDISPWCSLENVVLGRGVIVRDGTQLKNVVAGDGTRFGRNVSIYSPDANRPVRAGHHCWFAHGVLGEATGGEIEIGDYTGIGHYTVLLTSTGADHSPLLRMIYPLELAPVRIGPHGWLGAHCTILPGAQFAEGVVLAANSVAGRECYEAWTLYGGSPARMLRRMDKESIGAALREWHDPLS